MKFVYVTEVVKHWEQMSTQECNKFGRGEWNNIVEMQPQDL